MYAISKYTPFQRNLDINTITHDYTWRSLKLFSDLFRLYGNTKFLTFTWNIEDCVRYMYGIYV